MKTHTAGGKLIVRSQAHVDDGDGGLELEITVYAEGLTGGVKKRIRRYADLSEMDFEIIDADMVRILELEEANVSIGAIGTLLEPLEEV